jgi:hypothetical protein
MYRFDVFLEDYRISVSCMSDNAVQTTICLHLNLWYDTEEMQFFLRVSCYLLWQNNSACQGLSNFSLAYYEMKFKNFQFVTNTFYM